MNIYPHTDLVILAGGQSRRMQAKNKLLLCFDDEPQLSKIYRAFQHQVQNVWINSHRDHQQYRKMIANIKIFSDESDQHLGPLSGMQAAWQNISTDYVLFLPCDITYIPENILALLHLKLQQCNHAGLVYLCINQQPLYPFCLMKRICINTIHQQINQHKFSLKACFELLNAEYINIERPHLKYHSLNSLQELDAYQMSKKLRIN